MIGFEYICKLHGKQYKKIAEMLGISKQTINSWTSGKRKIPKGHLEELSKYFRIPEVYFQKELSKIDELEIQKMRFESELEGIEYEDTIIDPETGEEVSVISTYYDRNLEYAASRLDYEIKEKELIAHIENTLITCFDVNKSDGGLHDASEVLELFNIFTKIVSNEKSNRDTIQKVLNGIRASYQEYDTEDEFTKGVAELIAEHNENKKKRDDERKKYGDMADNEDLFG